MRTALLAAVAVVLAAAVALGVADERDGARSRDSPRALERAEVRAPLPRGAPAQLAALRRRANELRGGGARALDAQLRALRGHPVVVNVWASWCEPCRDELPLFQRQALKRGSQVAFLGVNSGDERAAAAAVAAELPLPYPSFEDPRQAVAGRYGARGLPATAFYDARGTLVLVHQGAFTSERQLAAEIERYALGAEAR